MTNYKNLRYTIAMNSSANPKSQKKFGIALDNEEATAMVTDLVNLVKVLLEPNNTDKIESKLEERSEYATIQTQQRYI